MRRIMRNMEKIPQKRETEYRKSEKFFILRWRREIRTFLKIKGGSLGKNSDPCANGNHAKPGGAHLDLKARQYAAGLTHGDIDR